MNHVVVDDHCCALCVFCLILLCPLPKLYVVSLSLNTIPFFVSMVCAGEPFDVFVLFVTLSDLFDGLLAPFEI